MRIIRLGLLGGLLCLRLPAPMIPGPNLNLAMRIESADAIIVARLISGTTLASGSQVSSDMVLRVDRVLKGDLVAGEIAAHLEGRSYYLFPNAKQSTITEQLYGIWFLSSATRPYTVISRDGAYGEIHFAPVILPESVPARIVGDTPARSVANELVATFEWMAEKYGPQLTPLADRNGTPEQRRLAGVYRNQFLSLADDFSTLNKSTTLPFYRQFAIDKSAPLRAFGITGLIASNDPEGIKRAAADWSELASTADLNPLIVSLMSYANDGDAEAVRALGALALRDPAEPGLRENAVYALRAIHSRATLPALIALLDHKEARVRPYALSGLCLFVRNAPLVTPQSVPSLSWLQSREPAPWLNPDTKRYCLLGATIGPAEDLDAHVAFWKSWWAEHQITIEKL